MTIPMGIRKKAERALTQFCEKRVPTIAGNKVSLDYTIRGNSVILFEKRPHYLRKEKIIEEPIAKMKYYPDSDEWQLCYQDRNLRWHEYWDLGPEKNIVKIIEEIDQDPTCIFWG